MQRKYGYFEDKGTYVILDTLKDVNAEFIYQNREILIKVDKYGLVSSQAMPPKDIMIFKRNDSDRFSKFQAFISCKEKGIKGISNFSFPRVKNPVNEYIKFAPEKAEYFYDYGFFSVKTTVGVPNDKSIIITEIEITNKDDKQLSFDVMPSLYPYVNNAVLAPWDKSEWYLKTSARKENGYTEFVTRLGNPSGDKTKRRLVTYQVSQEPSVEISMERYIGNGSFDFPDALNSQQLAISSTDLTSQVFSETDVMQCYAPVYAAKYAVKIKSGQSKCFTQVLTMQSLDNFGEYDKSQAITSSKYLDKEFRLDAYNQRRKFFNNLFSKRSISTNNKTFDSYVNGFLALQMYWVASLDRGWPTGMRGVRDAANDFMGMLYYDEKWAKEVLLYLFTCQRTDGWMPRQVSDQSRHGKHDLREYVDGGAFLLEFLYNYLAFSGDFSVLEKKLPWLDSDNENSLFEHAKKAIGYYIDLNNIGEHGLCKIRGGDWLDAMNNAGLEGRGESVMVTCQTIINLGYMAQIAKKCAKDYALADFYIKKAEELKKNVTDSAYNSSGFFNGVFNDDGKWIFSSNDSDGQERVYGPTNYYAIISKVADNLQTESILNNAKKLKNDFGYRLFAPALGKIPLEKAGRISSGDMPSGQWENATVYNHGSQGFLARALSVAGEGDWLEEVIDYILPFSQEKHPIDSTKSAPYAVVNCYQDLPLNRGRGGMQFLTGTIAMAVRSVYSFMLGICPTIDNLLLKPCLKKGEVNIKTEFSIRGSNITINYTGNNMSGKFSATLNGEELKITDNAAIIDYSSLKHNNEIIIEYS